VNLAALIIALLVALAPMAASLAPGGTAPPVVQPQDVTLGGSPS